jgi:CRISPR-associated endonuclease/helicase Cas3
LISNNQASGLYFALPTQITSNKIHERVEAFLRPVEIDPLQVRLAHSSAWLHEDLYVPKVDEALSWFASSKRALLCPFGVGTVDQALLGIVAAKHFFLRQFGLAGKVVILDEIHTYDLYTGTLLDKLVEQLRQLGCTVLILTATLTSRRREQLLQAANAQPVVAENAYPLLTFAPEGETPTAVRLAADPPKEFRVSIANASDDDLATLCLERGAAEQCVLWIRNTVADVQSSFRLLKNATRQCGPLIGLLHSRFPLWRMEELESFWWNSLGKSSTSRPPGCVLVATQIVEQSVDIDADFLVTDLAPTDMLFQRMGRLWRHERPERKGKPSILINSLGLTIDNYRCSSANDLKARLGRNRRVYAPYVLLRTFENWIHRSRIELPSGIRTILEATYSDPSADEPDGWNQLRRELQARTDKLRDRALSAALVLRQPALADEEGVQTRISDTPTVQILLASADPVRSPSGGTIYLPMVDGTDALIPNFRFDLAAARAIHRNLVRMPAWTLEGVSSTSPEWLSRLVSQNAVLGFVRENGAIFVDQSDSGMTWHRDEGVTLPRGN